MPGKRCVEKAHATSDQRSPELRPEGDTGIGWEESVGRVPRNEWLRRVMWKSDVTGCESAQKSIIGCWIPLLEHREAILILVLGDRCGVLVEKIF